MKIIEKSKEIREEIRKIRNIERQLEDNLLQRRFEIAVAKEMFGLSGSINERDNAG